MLTDLVDSLWEEAVPLYKRQFEDDWNGFSPNDLALISTLYLGAISETLKDIEKYMRRNPKTMESKQLLRRCQRGRKTR